MKDFFKEFLLVIREISSCFLLKHFKHVDEVPGSVKVLEGFSRNRIGDFSKRHECLCKHCLNKKLKSSGRGFHGAIII